MVIPGDDRLFYVRTLPKLLNYLLDHNLLGLLEPSFYFQFSNSFQVVGFISDFASYFLKFTAFILRELCQGEPRK